MKLVNRRKFIQGTGILAAALATKAHALETWSSGITPPFFQLPKGSVDCHMHIYDDRFPAAKGATLTPPNASIEQYRLLQQRLGITKNVIVTPSTYGTDNSVTLDALQKFGLKNARGIAVVDTSVTDKELKSLDEGGVRGIRFNLSYPGTTTAQMIQPLAKRIADLGWHIELVIPGDKLPDIESILSNLPCPLVLDHIAHISQPEGIHSKGFLSAKRLMEKNTVWTTLSGAYIDSKIGAPSYSDVKEVAQTFISMAPERILWGTDWPHPTQKATKPNDANLVDVFASWIEKPQWQQMIFVDNPSKLYRFE